MAHEAWGAGPPLPPAPSPPQLLTLQRYPGERGFGLVLDNMVVTDVLMNSAAQRAGADVIALGRRCTHVNDMPVYGPEDIEALARGPYARFRFASLTDADYAAHEEEYGAGAGYGGSPQPTQPHPSTYQPQPPWNARHGSGSPWRSTTTPAHPGGGGPAMQTPVQPAMQNNYTVDGADIQGEDGDIVVRVNRATPSVPLGVVLREPGLTLEKVDTGSPADRAGLKRLVGHQLTHTSGRYVVMTYDIAAASEGLLCVEFRFKPKLCGLIVRRRHHDIPWGFGINAITLDIVDIIEGSPGEAAGLNHWRGHQVTHVNGRHIKSAFELVRMMDDPRMKELQLRFCPWSLEECAQLPISREIEEVPVAFAPGQSLGLGLSAVMVLVDVVPGSPADQQNLLDYAGWCLTHVDQVPVFNSEDVVLQTQGKTAARLRFEEVMVDTLVSPDQLAQENVNINKYREWLGRRSQTRDRAKQASVDTRQQGLQQRQFSPRQQPRQQVV